MNGTDYDFDFSGHGDMNNRFVPDRATAFKSDKSWLKIDGGQHHSIALDGTGKNEDFPFVDCCSIFEDNVFQL